VRSLIADLRDAYCVELRRTRIGPFDVADASDEALPLADALARVLPTLTLQADAARRLGHGRLLALPPEAPAGLDVLVLDPAGEPVAIAEVEAGELRPRVGFRA
jgi:tRNA pseudouridine55 synthase